MLHFKTESFSKLIHLAGSKFLILINNHKRTKAMTSHFISMLPDSLRVKLIIANTEIMLHVCLYESNLYEQFLNEIMNRQCLQHRVQISKYKKAKISIEVVWTFRFQSSLKKTFWQHFWDFRDFWICWTNIYFETVFN